MATNHTTNYQLNLWEPGDKFVRSEFNENTSKIDAALAAHENRLNAKADAAAVSALQTAVAGKADAAATTAAIAAKPSVIIGTYTGNASKSSLEGYQEINLGVRPRLVLVASEYAFEGQVAMVCGTARTNFENLKITDTGFRVGTRGNACPNTNQPDFNYCYLAII